MRFRRNLERIGEIFAYEISKTLTGDDSHPHTHFLCDQKEDRHGNECPEQRVAVFCPGGRVRCDAAYFVS